MKKINAKNYQKLIFLYLKSSNLNKPIFITPTKPTKLTEKILSTYKSYNFMNQNPNTINISARILD